MNNKDESLTRLLRINEAARLLGVHPATLRRWDIEGKLRAVRIGERRRVGDRRYRLEDIQKFIKR